MLIEAAQIQRCISIIFKLRAINKNQMHTEIRRYPTPVNPKKNARNCKKKWSIEEVIKWWLKSFSRS